MEPERIVILEEGRERFATKFGLAGAFPGIAVLVFRRLGRRLSPVFRSLGRFAQYADQSDDEEKATCLSI
jgi:hypothetical protein